MVISKAKDEHIFQTVLCQHADMSKTFIFVPFTTCAHLLFFSLHLSFPVFLCAQTVHVLGLKTWCSFGRILSCVPDVLVRQGKGV